MVVSDKTSAQVRAQAAGFYWLLEVRFLRQR
jgi:hypothetical protein